MEETKGGKHYSFIFFPLFNQVQNWVLFFYQFTILFTQCDFQIIFLSDNNKSLTHWEQLLSATFFKVWKPLVNFLYVWACLFWRFNMNIIIKNVYESCILFFFSFLLITNGHPLSHRNMNNICTRIVFIY